MLGDGATSSVMMGAINGSENLRNDLSAYMMAKKNGDDTLFDKYVDGAYDSSADYWKLVKKENGQWGWAPDGSLDFNFDLKDEEIRKAFYSAFGDDLSNAKIAGDIGSIAFVNMTLEKRSELGLALEIKDPEGTKYLRKPGDDPIDFALRSFIVDTENKLNESISRDHAINTYSSDVSQLREDGVTYGYGGGDKDSNGIVLGSSATMDCTALISYLTQTTRTNTTSFGGHGSFEKSAVKMPGDVLIYFAVNPDGKRDNHAVMWLGGDKIVESSSAGNIGPRESTLSKLERFYTNKGYTFTQESYGLKTYKVRRW
jgi:hypothetical protein